MIFYFVKRTGNNFIFIGGSYMELHSTKTRKVSVWLALIVLALQSLVPTLTVVAEGVEETKDNAVVTVKSLTESGQTENEVQIKAVLALANTTETDETVDLEANTAMTAKSETGTITQPSNTTLQVVVPKTTKNEIVVTFTMDPNRVPDRKFTLTSNTKVSEVTLSAPYQSKTMTTESTASSVATDSSRVTSSNAVATSSTTTNSSATVQSTTRESQTSAQASTETTPKEDAEADPDPESTVSSTSATEESSTSSSTSKATQPRVQSASMRDPKELENVFTFDSLKIDDKDVSSETTIEVTSNSKAALTLTWDTENQKDGVVNNDTASYQLPDVFKQVTTPVQPVIVDGIQVGTYIVKNGLLTLTFNEEAQENDIKNGTFTLQLEFDESKFKEQALQEVPFHDTQDKTLTIAMKPSTTITELTKKGEADRQENARNLKWTIDYLNSSAATVNSPTIKDVLPAGVQAATSFVVIPLTIGGDGTVREGQAIKITPKKNTAQGFDLTLPDVKGYAGYRIQYETAIDDRTKTTFENQVTVTANGETSAPVKSTIDKLTRTDTLEKSGKQVDGTEDIIEWTLTLNRNGSGVTNAILSDTLPAGNTLVKDSLVITKNNTEPVTVSSKNNQFPTKLVLGKIEENDIYTVTYRTKVDYSQINNGVYQQNNRFENQATLSDGQTAINNAKATVDINRSPLLTKFGNATVDYDTKKIHWTLTINAAKQNLKDVMIQDKIPNGLKLTGDILVKVEGEKDATKSQFPINLKKVGTKKVTIEYETEITDFSQGTFTNEATISGEGIGTETATASQGVGIVENQFTKRATGIDYENQTIGWEITVDPTREAMQSLTITDSFVDKGQVFSPNDLTVTKGGKVYTAYELSRVMDGFVLNFNEFSPSNLLNEKLVITYKTSFDPNKVAADSQTSEPTGKNKYTNLATFAGKTKSGIDFTSDKEAKAT